MAGGCRADGLYMPREKSPSPPFRGEREGPVARKPQAHGLDPWGRDGEGGGGGNWLLGPPSRSERKAPLRPSGGRGRGLSRVSRKPTGLTRGGGTVRWAATQTGSLAPL